MGLKKLVERDGQCVQVPYAWYDYVMFPFKVVLFLSLLVIVAVAMAIARFLNWLASHPKIQLFDHRGR